MKDLLNKLKQLLKSKYFWIGVYVVTLVLSFRYVSTLLKTETVDVLESKEVEKGVEVKPVKVKLIVEFPTTTKEYTYAKTNMDSVMDLMNTLRKNTDFRYEKTFYINRTTIDHINYMYPQAEYVWKIFLDDKDITQNFQDVYLTDNSTYYLKLVKQ